MRILNFSYLWALMKLIKIEDERFCNKIVLPQLKMASMIVIHDRHDIFLLFIYFISDGCAFINSFNNEFVFDITGPILEHYKSCRIFKNANAYPCIGYDCSGLDDVSANLYTTVTGLGRKAIRGFIATV